MADSKDAGEIIWRTTITTRDGRVIRASDYGIRAFPIRGSKD